jgi:alpha-L-glutamate ligase-like protein
MKWFISWRQLREHGILGMNSRNIEFIYRYNPRRWYSLVDDKLKTKQLAERHGIPTPKLLFFLREQHQIRHVEGLLDKIGSFAAKPAKGSGGKGILLISENRDRTYIKASGTELTIRDVRHHLSNILAGLFSLAGTPDVAIGEELIQFNDLFDGYSYEGVPDIRIIVFQGYPVMAMLRLATKDSDGRANLHQGAVGVGLDLATGRAINAVQYSLPVAKHPDTGKLFDPIKIPEWTEILRMAARGYEMTGLGYMGVDIVIDKQRGPLLLEMNARPGLTIQLANGIGIVQRLRLIEKLSEKSSTAEGRVSFSMENFGGRDLNVVT